jgi:Fic family protein
MTASSDRSGWDGRAGRFILQLDGYRAFEPANLPPVPAIEIDDDLIGLLSRADLALGRLDGVTSILPNPDLFVAMYVKQEAVLSSQIEGTQASLTDVLMFEAGESPGVRDVGEVVNYVAAMNHGLEQTALPLSLRLLREIHGLLLERSRGKESTPGEFRRTQNWIGPAGCTLATATFVPPPPHLLLNLLGNLEKFLHDATFPPLIHVGLIHAQFETIHPFLDGNGRLGRLLITFLLCKRKILSRPLLYLSLFLKQRRTDYYEHLQAVRTHGAWEAWLKFFLRGVHEVATQAYETALKIFEMRTRYQILLQDTGNARASLLRALDLLFIQPLITPKNLANALGISHATANNYVKQLAQRRILIKQPHRNRTYLFEPYLQLFEIGPTRYFDPSDLSLTPQPRVPLTPGQIERVTAARRIFSEFSNDTLSDWIAEFEQERDPEHEIAMWEAMARAYTRFIKGRPLSAEARLEAYGLLLIRTGEATDAVLARNAGNLHHLSLFDAEVMLDGYSLMPSPVHVTVEELD